MKTEKEIEEKLNEMRKDMWSADIFYIYGWFDALSWVSDRQ